MRLPLFRSTAPSVAPAVPSTQPEGRVGNAAYTFLDKKGDPERNVYATQTGRVVNEAREAAQQSMHRHQAFMRQLKGSTPVVASDPAAPRPGIDMSEIDYDVSYRAGVRTLKTELKAQGMKFPSKLSSLPFGAREALKNVATSTYNLQHADPDATLKSMTYLERKNRERFEKGLAIDKRVIDYVQDKLTSDVEKLQYLFVADGRHVAPRGDTPSSLKVFFQKYFKVSLEKNEARRFEANFRHAATDAAKQEVLAEYRNALLRKIPWGAPDNGLPANRSTYEIAEAVMQERVHQTAVARSLKADAATLVINGGSLFLEKGREGDGFAFRLRQPYGQHEFQPVGYELRFTAPEGSRRFEMQLLRISEEGESTPIPLPEDPADARPVLDQYMNKTDLGRLFNDHTELGKSGFAELYGEYKAQQALMAEVRKSVYRPLKEALIADIGGKNITSVQMTGFSYNYGHYGENLAVNDRGVMMGLMHELAGEGKLAIIASCGGHQDLLYNVGGVHIGNIPDMLNKTYLPDERHANDPFTVEEKQSNAAIHLHTLSAAIFEKPIGQADDGPDRLRGATPHTPIAQQRNFSVARSRDDDQGTDAQQRAVWAPREAAPLSLPLLSRTPDIDPLTGQPVLDESGKPVTVMEVRPFTFHHEGRPVIASGNLKLASGIDANGTTVELEDGKFPEAKELATWQRIELKHELPEGYGLKDDEGRPVLDERGHPVRLLEKISIVPQEGSTEVYRMEQDENGKLQPVWHDSNGRRVFPRYTDTAPPAFFDGSGNPAALPVALQRDRQPVIQFGITGIERWVRVSLSVPTDKDKARLDENEHVLCTYEKRVQSVEEQNLDVAILQDPMYTRINCVHSQNGINTPWDRPAGAVEMTGSAVKPNDIPGGRRHLLGVSLNNPSPHPIAANPSQPRESYINETALNVLGHGHSVISHQPHSDMLREEGGVDANGNRVAANPYTVGRLSTEISPEYRGQRQGNAEGVLTGMHLRNLRRTVAEIKTAGDAVRSQEPRVNEDALAYLDGFDMNRLVGAYPDSLTALRNLALPQDQSLATKIGTELASMLDRLPAGVSALNDAILTYRTALEQALQQPVADSSHTEDTPLDVAGLRGKHFNSLFSAELRARLQSHLNGIHGIGTFDNENRSLEYLTDAAIQARIAQLSELVNVLNPDSFNISLGAPDACQTALKSLRDMASAMDAENLNRTMTEFLDAARTRLRTIETTALRPSEVIEAPRLQTLQTRNDALYHRFRRDSQAPLAQATLGQLAYELFAGQNFSRKEIEQASAVNKALAAEPQKHRAEKEALAAELERRRANKNSLSTDDLKFINDVLAAWETLNSDASEAVQPRAPGLPRNAGPSTKLVAIPKADEQLLGALTETLDARELIKAVFDGKPIEDVEAWKNHAATVLASTGLLDHLGNTQEERAAQFNRLLNDRAALNETAAHVDIDHRIAVTESVAAQVRSLNDMIQAYGSTPKDQVADGPQLRFRALHARGWQLGTGVTATVGTSGPLNSTLNAINEAAGNVSEAASQAFTALTAADATLFSTTLFLAGVEGTKNAMYGKQRIDKTIPAYETKKTELEQLQRSLQESIDAIKTELGETGSEAAREATQEAARQSPLDRKRIENLVDTVAARMDAVEDKLKILRQASHAHAFNMANNPLLSLAAAAGLTTTALGLAGVATIASGPVGGALLAGFGAAGAARSLHELLKDSKVTPDITGSGLGVDSGIRRRLNTALQNRRQALMWDIGAKSTLAAGGAMAAVGAGLLATPAAPVGPVLIGVGSAMIFSGAAGAYLPPRREWRGVTTLAAENTTLLKGNSLTTNFRRNRALHHLGAKTAMASELINKISDRALQASDLAEGRQFRQTFKTTRKLRWLAPDIHRKELAKVIARHAEETKDEQFIFMYHSNLHELNWLQTYVDELSGELEKVTGGLSEFAKASRMNGNASDAQAEALLEQLNVYAGSLANELNHVQGRYKACSDLHDKLTAYATELGRRFRPDTKNQFDDLRIRYLIVHDVVADTMSRKDAIAMVRDHENLPSTTPRLLTARIGDQTYDRAHTPVRNPAGKVSNVEFSYTDETVNFIRQQFARGRGNGLENSWAAMVAGNLSDKWTYEMLGVLHLAAQTSRTQAEAHMAAARGQATADDANPAQTSETRAVPGKKGKGVMVTTEQLVHDDAGDTYPDVEQQVRTQSTGSARTAGSVAKRRMRQTDSTRTAGSSSPPLTTFG